MVIAINPQLALPAAIAAFPNWPVTTRAQVQLDYANTKVDYISIVDLSAPRIPLTTEQMQEYVGRYELTPSKIYEIRSRNGALEGQETGRRVEALSAEVPDMLFVPGQPRYRKIFLREASGRVTAFAERREAWDLVWKRLP